jgi:hypothetical protein
MDASGTIFIEEERYEKFGAGMGKMPGVGRMVKQGKQEAIVDMHMPVGSLFCGWEVRGWTIPLSGGAGGSTCQKNFPISGCGFPDGP